MSDMARAYARCLYLERERERKHRKYTACAASDTRAFHHEAPQTRGEDDEELDYGWDVSDKGAGAESVRTFEEAVDSAYYRTCVKRAMNRLRNRPELQKTLRLVVKNGNRREDSMWEILASGRCPTWDAAKTLYWTHLKKMLNIFCGQ